ncbi:hypothetical protein BJX63DRAFT_410944 [Aspergillus granulosus]|uniref:Secreted protein n=1 Tax=Aspergillus granulosus TaxID=176169 RepID=A0ABR4GZ93_9EURO
MKCFTRKATATLLFMWLVLIMNLSDPYNSQTAGLRQISLTTLYRSVKLRAWEFVQYSTLTILSYCNTSSQG